MFHGLLTVAALAFGQGTTLDSLPMGFPDTPPVPFILPQQPSATPAASDFIWPTRSLIRPVSDKSGTEQKTGDTPKAGDTPTAAEGKDDAAGNAPNPTAASWVGSSTSTRWSSSRRRTRKMRRSRNARAVLRPLPGRRRRFPAPSTRAIRSSACRRHRHVYPFMKAIYGGTRCGGRHQGQPDQVRRLGHRVRQLEHRQELQHADVLLDRPQPLRAGPARVPARARCRTRCRPTTSTGASAPSRLYGIDYRYMTAGGWVSDQLLKHNLLYGWDPDGAVLRRLHPRVPAGA